MTVSKMFKNAAFSAVALAFVGALAFSPNALADEGKTYEVTIANATKGQPLAPGLLIVHSGGYSLFQINDAPTLPLATMAETGDPHDLQDEVNPKAGVDQTAILPGIHGPGLALPGESNQANFTTNAKYLTVVGMLAATNDAFYAVRGVELPKNGKITVYAIAYDAGSEENNEADGDVPASTSGNGADTGTNVDPKEGFIHVHNGIHGGAFLVPADHDWRNPVVAITIERLSDDD